MSDSGPFIGTGTKLAAGAFAVLLGVAGWQYLHPKTTLAVEGNGSAWDAAIERARADQKPTIVFFTADWCGACQSFKSGVLSQSEVLNAMYGKYAVIVVDLTDPSSPGAERAQRYGVRSIPTLIRFDAEGKETDRTHGMSSDAFLKWLAKS